ncbi:MAG: peptidase C39 family protein [Nanoarchaeota archaeon]
MNKVPYYHQHTEYSCGPASLSMVLEFFGVEEREEKLRKLEHTTRKDGTKHRYMILCARKEGFYCYVHQHASLEVLRYFLVYKL